MTCSEAERLFDAYLDGYLSGTLRLELDAHRLRCRRCQQTLAMLESCGHVIASDRREPAASMDFTERVMSKIGRRGAARQHTIRFRSMRAAVAIGVVVQAAAVLMIAILLPSGTDNSPIVSKSPELETLLLMNREDIAPEQLKSAIIATVNTLKEAFAAGDRWHSDIPMLAMVASSNLQIPEGMERVSEWRPAFNLFEFLNAHSTTDPGESGETQESNPGSYSF